MKRLLLLFVTPCLAFNAVSPTVDLCTTSPASPPGEEFYWDDGIMSSGWCWYTGGNYWAVQFDELKTGGYDSGVVIAYGAMTYLDWPDSTYQGCYMHTFSDLGGYPGSDLDSTFLQFDPIGVFQWLETYPDEVQLSTDVFYIAFQQIGNYPSCDSVAVDAHSGTHNWTGFYGSWSPTNDHGDFMIRCSWVCDGYDDIYPPYVSGEAPADGAQDVSVYTVIRFHVVDDYSGVDIETIDFSVEDTSRSPARVNLASSTDGPSPAGEITGELEINDSDVWDVVCTFTPDDDLPYGDTITCTVAAGLSDHAGNETEDDIVWSFETREEPRVTNATWGEIKALY